MYAFVVNVRARKKSSITYIYFIVKKLKRTFMPIFFGQIYIVLDIGIS